jgi:triacylglycerol esterase/lipase EstA (alpha/beta hydrolase family)
MFRLLRFAPLISALALLLTVTVAVPAASAGTTGPTSLPVVFVHGFNHDNCSKPGLNVTAAMSGPMQELTKTGWSGRLDVVSYYACDQGGSRIGSDTVSTPIETIAAQLANYIYRTYTAHGQAVDIVAHSMGGLVARVAVENTESHVAGFPSSLLVKRVVAFSTPYNGLSASTINTVAGLPGTYQASEMLAGSSFLQSLHRAGIADGTGGTDWLTVGSSGGCDFVPGPSASSLPDALHIVYTGCWSHFQYLYNFTKTRSYPAYLNSSATTTYGSLELMRIFLSQP